MYFHYGKVALNDRLITWENSKLYHKVQIQIRNWMRARVVSLVFPLLIVFLRWHHFVFGKLGQGRKKHWSRSILQPSRAVSRGLIFVLVRYFTWTRIEILIWWLSHWLCTVLNLDLKYCSYYVEQLVTYDTLSVWFDFENGLLGRFRDENSVTLSEGHV